MRTIIKGVEPSSLIAHRKTPYCDYDNYTDKDELRRTLVAEQHGLCCYCMGRIRSETTSMKIEHWQCQSRYPEKQLNYQNLLGVCMGGESMPEDQQHCDTKKGDLDFRWNPANRAHHIEMRLRYETNGSIRSDDNGLNVQLEAVLNLNLPLLKNNRKAVLEAIMGWWKYEKNRLHGPVPRELLERQRNRLIDRVGDFQPYCQVTVWWLEQRLART